ncbi:MAG: zinc ribbon domain-containing protein [Anaerolineales bacterium]|nr:zinc ribbon domain-containing protein [Anaerolineales bacterium]
MPLFEFVCADCNQPFEELLRSSSLIGEVTCPACGSRQIKKKVSTFASKISGGGSFSLGASTAASCSTGST